jgi:hypothetical protein
MDQELKQYLEGMEARTATQFKSMSTLLTDVKESLHQRLDELVADFLTHNAHALPSTTSVMDLIKWSHAQTIEPAETPTASPQPSRLPVS